MNIGHIKQIILYVQDMQSQVEFYRDLLGLEVVFPIKNDYSNEDWVSFSTGECSLALHSGGQGRIGEDATKFTFEVENVEKTREHLINEGIKMGEIVQAYPGSFVCGGWDPEEHVFYVQSFP